jgi:hypothetical protein
MIISTSRANCLTSIVPGSFIIIIIISLFYLDFLVKLINKRCFTIFVDITAFLSAFTNYPHEANWTPNSRHKPLNSDLQNWLVIWADIALVSLCSIVVICVLSSFVNHSISCFLLQRGIS